MPGMMQLPPVITLRPAQEAEARRSAGLGADWLEAHKLAHLRHSAFHAAEQAAGGALLLDEHFRCHPTIARLSSEHFYGGKLTVLTDVRSQLGLDRPAVIWADPSGRPERGAGGSWVNRAEAERVERSVRYLLDALPEGATVGVVTPYSAQASLIKSRIRDVLDVVRVGTAHTFQGGERDAMVLSAVAGPGMPKGSLSWLENGSQLWNVAITRARSHLIVVGDADHWAATGGIVAALHAAAGTSAIPADDPDDLLNRLYARLGPGTTLSTPVLGHLADAVVERDGGRVVVVLDRGHGDTDPVRHLRLTDHRRRLLADPVAVRVPAWRLYDTTTALF